MILIIDTSKKECMVGLGNDQEIDRFVWEWKKDTGSETLKNIKKILSKEKIKLTDLKVIAVNQGPGSYTGVRVGITVANTLGWSLNIPVFGYKDENLDHVLGEISKKLKKGKIPHNHFPTPNYK